MQNELAAQYPVLKITIGGINQTGLESGNDSILAGRDLIWLQDKDTNQNANGEIWDAWQAEWRDVFILDGKNATVQVYNLTTYGLATPANYAELKNILVNAAMTTQKPYTFASRPVDVDGNGIVAPLDALLIINKLNKDGAGPLPAPTTNSVPAYVDVDSNLILAPIDALTVINVLNHPTSSGEGEAAVPRGSLVDYPSYLWSQSSLVSFPEAVSATAAKAQTTISNSTVALPSTDNHSSKADLAVTRPLSPTPWSINEPISTKAVTVDSSFRARMVDLAIEEWLSDWSEWGRPRSPISGV